MAGYSFKGRAVYHVFTGGTGIAGRIPVLGSPDMKLHLITASIVAYTILAMAWICYSELALP
ncbi:MAG TPA: hypothetical protein VFG03_00720 [Telluria sp.]|nr:hypothetical protein [Telluria sp.]